MLSGVIDGVELGQGLVHCSQSPQRAFLNVTAGALPYSFSTGWIGHSDVHQPLRHSNRKPISAAIAAAPASIAAVAGPLVLRLMWRSGTMANSATALASPSHAAKCSGIFPRLESPKRRGRRLKVAMGQMLRHKPGRIVTSAGAAGIRMFHMMAMPTAGRAIKSQTSANPPSSSTYCAAYHWARACGERLRPLPWPARERPAAPAQFRGAS